MNIRTGAAIAALSLGLSGALPAFAETTLRISTFVPPNHSFNEAIRAWGEELSELSNGELQIELFPAGQLGPPPRQFELARSGAADVALVLHGATPGRFPVTELAGLPLTAPSAGNESTITSRRLTELAPDYLAAEHEGTRILWMAVTPPLKIHFTSADPSDLANLEGLRIRYAGTVWQQIIEVLGASPVPVPPAESADAMGRGVVDAASFPFEAAQSFDLAPVTEYSMEPGLASATFALVMSQATYDGLAPELQAIIDETTGPDRAEWFGAIWDEGEAGGRAYMEEAGVQIVTLDEAALAELHTDFQSIIDGAISAVAAGGAPAQAFLDAYTE